MKSKFYLVGYDNTVRKITKKEAMLMISKAQFEEAKKDWMQDPDTCIQYMVQGGRLQIEFSI